MQVTIDGTPKEIAALALELQERRVLEDLAHGVIDSLQLSIDRSERELRPPRKPK